MILGLKGCPFCKAGPETITVEKKYASNTGKYVGQQLICHKCKATSPMERNLLTAVVIWNDAYDRIGKGYRYVQKESD